MVKRKGRKPKTIAEKNAETRDKMNKILEIARIHTNIVRNLQAIKDNKKYMRRLIKDARTSHSRDEKKILKYYQEDFQISINKLASFVKEDVSNVKTLVKEIELKEHKKRKVKK